MAATREHPRPTPGHLAGPAPGPERRTIDRKSHWQPRLARKYGRSNHASPLAPVRLPGDRRQTIPRRVYKSDAPLIQATIFLCLPDSRFPILVERKWFTGRVPPCQKRAASSNLVLRSTFVFAAVSPFSDGFLLRSSYGRSSMSPQRVQYPASGRTGAMQWLHTSRGVLDAGAATPQCWQYWLVMLISSPHPGQTARG